MQVPDEPIDHLLDRWWYLTVRSAQYLCCFVDAIQHSGQV